MEQPPVAVTARPASSVVLVRATAGGGWETYLLRRSAQSPVLADIWVFPGGTLRSDDLAPAAEDIDPDFSADAAHGALSRPPGAPASTPRESLGHFVAAARELLEEAGIVLAKHPLSTKARAPNRLDQARQEIEGGRPLVEVLQTLEISLALRNLTYYGHWITPEAVPQRFDTRFFLTVLPAGQEASPSAFEMADAVWVNASEAIERSRQGTLPLHFATWNHLRRLAPYATLDAVVEFAQTKPVATVMPATRAQDGRIAPYLPAQIQEAW